MSSLRIQQNSRINRKQLYIPGLLHRKGEIQPQHFFPQPHISESDQTVLKAHHGNIAYNPRNMEAEAEGSQIQDHAGLAWLQKQQNLPLFHSTPLIPTFTHLPLQYQDTDKSGWVAKEEGDFQEEPPTRCHSELKPPLCTHSEATCFCLLPSFLYCHLGASLTLCLEFSRALADTLANFFLFSLS